MARTKETRELEAFDWFKPDLPQKFTHPIREFISIIQVMDETPYDRKLRMLTQLGRACTACTMCDLGFKVATKNGEARDPHVFSNMNPTRFMVVGQGPGWDEVRLGEPFIGPSGNNFNTEIIKHGLERKDFYISNAVRCFIEGNKAPDTKQMARCRPFLEMEINLLHPHFIITLGAIAFGSLCPSLKFGDSLGKFNKSEYFDINVFPIYHPSPRNLSDSERMAKFRTDIKTICGVIKALKAQS
jgi:DNA polymerase